jgi:hypothetical protein
MPPKFYSLADQKLYEKYKYIPREEYRLGLTLPTDATEDEVVTDEGIVNTNAFANAGGGGDNFSVYNPDPNTISNQDYDPFPYRQAAEMNLIGSGDSQFDINKYGTGFRTKTEANKFMDMYPEYYRGDDDEEPTGIRSLISKGVNLMPGMGMLRMGVQALGDLLPTNQRAIMENELGGQGVLVNDIGQIVQGQGDYNTGANIMAGYNANKITDSTIQKRRDTINKSLGKFDKYDPNSVNFDPGKYQEMMDKLDALDEFQKIKDIAFARSNIVYANENYDPSIETPVGADTITGPNINEEEGRPENPGPSINEQIDNNNPNNNNNNNDGGGNGGGFNSDNSSGYDGGNFCFDPKTLIQMADGSTKQIKNIQLGDATKGGEVTGVFQFKAADEIHDYKGVTVAGSHYVKEDGRFIMVKDSPLAVKINKIPVVYSLDTTGRRIFINDIEFADYNGDGVAKNFLSNAGVDLSGFDKEVLRQVENRLI